ncbi:uncharacterized protein PAC_17613 [Phialocephala subalpina]|uniref:Uncharacterized protein n=1 Tax=Phialocephala subalpina TaxID=576137 RepID=A0A1L7XRP3_9HELO|nr:uncharacterized protein PAC_17613 [Phialocephala subalpina]
MFSKTSKRHRPSGKHSNKAPWSKWCEDAAGVEYRTRLRSNGRYERQERPLQQSQVATPEDAHDYSEDDQGSEGEEGKRAWKYDAGLIERPPSTGSDKPVQPPPPNPPFVPKPSKQLYTPPRSPQQPSITSSPAYIHTAPTESLLYTNESEEVASGSWNEESDVTWRDESFYVNVEGQEGRALVTTNSECFVTAKFAKKLLHLQSEMASESRKFTHPSNSMQIKGVKTKERIEATIDYNGKRAKSQRLYILPKDVQLDEIHGELFLSRKVFDFLQNTSNKTNARGLSMNLPLRNSARATSSQYQGQADPYQSSYSTESRNRIEQDPRHFDSGPVDEYQQSQPYDPQSSEFYPQQSSNSTEYDSGDTAHLADAPFTASPTTGDYPYRAYAGSSNTSRYQTNY